MMTNLDNSTRRNFRGAWLGSVYLSTIREGNQFDLCRLRMSFFAETMVIVDVLWFPFNNQISLI